VTIAELHVTPGHWLTVKLTSLQVANLSGGTRPQMVTLRDLTAEIDVHAKASDITVQTTIGHF